MRIPFSRSVRRNRGCYGMATSDFFSTVRRAFTLLELLVVVAVIALLAGLLLPALAGAKAKASGTACLNNLKQLQLCWQMYVDDHDGWVPPNLSLNTNGAWRSTPDSWIGSSSAPHDTDTQPIQNGLLFKYDYNRSVRLYHCPADKSHVRSFTGQDLGILRTRSYSMNGNLGGRTSEVQQVVFKAAQIPAPSQLFVFIDENEESIDDAHFLVWPAPDDRWVNMPADRHGRVGVLSFADGHAASWKWCSPKKFVRNTYWKRAESPQDLADLRRLQEVTLELKGAVLQP